MGVGDDVEQHRRISEPKLAEIEEQLSAFAAACEEDGAPVPSLSAPPLSEMRRTEPTQ